MPAINLALNQDSFTFMHTINPVSSQAIQFSGKALAAGDFSGSIDVCINSASNCMSFLTRTIVEEK
jgi:hypothetical protein